jgi:hypothetical protein
VTRTGTAPVPAGATAVHEVVLSQPTAEAATPPNVMAVAPPAVLKPLPATLTTLPAAPRGGVRATTDGTTVNVDAALADGAPAR